MTEEIFSTEDAGHLGLVKILEGIKGITLTSDKERVSIYQLGEFEGDNIDLALMPANSKHPPHIHENSDATIYVIAGSGIAYIGMNVIFYNSGRKLLVPRGIAHGFDVREETLLLSVQKGKIKSGDKIDFRYTQ
jgi:quercetin dioxygenase-like cupin family protein